MMATTQSPVGLPYPARTLDAVLVVNEALYVRRHDMLATLARYGVRVVRQVEARFVKPENLRRAELVVILRGSMSQRDAEGCEDLAVKEDVPHFLLPHKLEAADWTRMKAYIAAHGRPPGAPMVTPADTERAPPPPPSSPKRVEPRDEGAEMARLFEDENVKLREECARLTRELAAAKASNALLEDDLARAHKVPRRAKGEGTEMAELLALADRALARNGASIERIERTTDELVGMVASLASYSARTAGALGVSRTLGLHPVEAAPVRPALARKVEAPLPDEPFQAPVAPKAPKAKPKAPEPVAPPKRAAAKVGRWGSGTTMGERVAAHLKKQPLLTVEELARELEVARPSLGTCIAELRRRGIVTTSSATKPYRWRLARKKAPR